MSLLFLLFYLNFLDVRIIIVKLKRDSSDRQGNLIGEGWGINMI